MPPVRSPRRGYALVATGALFFVVNAGVSRVIQSAGVDSLTLTTVRCTGTALVLVLVAAARRERLRLPSSRRELAMVLGFGVSGVALVQWFYFVAIARLPVGIALLLEFTAPILVAVFVRLVYRERLRRRVWVGIGSSLLGLAAVARVWDGLTLDLLGVVAGFGAAVSLAAYFLLGERSVGAASPFVVITEAFVVAALFWNVVRPVTGLFTRPLTQPRSLGGSLAAMSAPLWLLLAWMILLGTVVPFLAELSSLRHLTATEVTVLGMLEPVGATVLGWLWFRQDLAPVQVVGIGFVLTGIILAQTARTGSGQAESPTSLT